MEAWSAYSTAWDNSYFGMTQFNTDLAAIGITCMAWRGKWNEDVHTQTGKKKKKSTAHSNDW